MKSCVKCGTLITDDSFMCEKCGATQYQVWRTKDAIPQQEDNTPVDSLNEATPNYSERRPLSSRRKFDIIIFAIYLLLAIVVLVLFIEAANSIKEGGIDIMRIQSVGGKTLEEAYYQGLGYVYEGYYLATITLGVFCSAVLLAFGVKGLRHETK